MENSDKQRYLQNVTRKLVSLTAACVLILVISFYVIREIWPAERTYLVAFVFVSGLTGGFVSIQQRLPKIGLDELRELSSSWLSILLVPINGGIFAIVLMLMFISEIIQGVLFPEYFQVKIEITDITGSFQKWSIDTFPKTGIDIAKLLFWSFVAGFSERFVPQIVRKTADEATGT